MDISELLEKNRPKLREMDVSEVLVSNPHDDNEVKGRIAEHFVYQWLKKCSISTFLEEGNYNGYEVFKRYGGYVIQDKSKHLVSEVDSIFSYEGRIYFAEVKSNGLNRIESKAISDIAIGKDLFPGMSIEVLLFFPHIEEKVNLLSNLGKYQEVHYVDLKYSKKHLERALKRYRKLHE